MEVFKQVYLRLILIILELFYVLTGGLVIFIVMELLWPGIILAYFNLNWALILWIIAGIVILYLNNGVIKNNK
jgi:hypothetical protein